MNKPVVAALNGLAMGGGTELATRCHSVVAMEKAFMQLSGNHPGNDTPNGGVVVPYRKWPKAAAKFHAMISKSERLTAQEAAEIGIVKKIVKTFPELIDAAIAEVDNSRGISPGFPRDRWTFRSSLFLMRQWLGIFHSARKSLESSAASSTRPQSQDAGGSSGDRLFGCRRYLLCPGLQRRG